MCSIIKIFALSCIKLFEKPNIIIDWFIYRKSSCSALITGFGPSKNLRLNLDKGYSTSLSSSFNLFLNISMNSFKSIRSFSLENVYLLILSYQSFYIGISSSNRFLANSSCFCNRSSANLCCSANLWSANTCCSSNSFLANCFSWAIRSSANLFCSANCSFSDFSSSANFSFFNFSCAANFSFIKFSCSANCCSAKLRCTSNRCSAKLRCSSNRSSANLICSAILVSMLLLIVLVSKFHLFRPFGLPLFFFDLHIFLYQFFFSANRSSADFCCTTNRSSFNLNCSAINFSCFFNSFMYEFVSEITLESSDDSDSVCFSVILFCVESPLSFPTVCSSFSGFSTWDESLAVIIFPRSTAGFDNDDCSLKTLFLQL
ncbi:hypothetical protein DERP_002432 [Dermatophagoides pteronyssinus]|uniref:Uncharacterized protein n=1 Tax=Dermatophagoides pteronyssinus TaxID=6956 RepID=A0ABQ8JHP3_DERPT|nr:hypothetical protein DERP_002432 [Dermatophagoides pteronyssinus]